MVPQKSLLVLLVRLDDRIPMPTPPKKRGRGRPRIYTRRLFPQALVIMILRKAAPSARTLCRSWSSPQPKMQTLRALLRENGRYPTRRTFDRRTGRTSPDAASTDWCLGRHLVALIQPWQHGGRAAAMDSTVLRAKDAAVWHKKDRDKVSCRSRIDTEAGGQIGLAWMGLRLETAHRFGGGRCLDSSCGPTDGTNADDGE